MGQFRQINEMHALTLLAEQRIGKPRNKPTVGQRAGPYTFLISVRPQVNSAYLLPQSIRRERQPAGRSRTPRRILVADDNEDAAQSLAMFLEMTGHETRVASNGAEALAIADAFTPNVAVLHIAMPILDGLGAARALHCF